jgi:hypothetical protein
MPLDFTTLGKGSRICDCITGCRGVTFNIDRTLWKWASDIDRGYRKKIAIEIDVMEPRWREMTMKELILTLAITALSFSASAAGIDSRAYTCTALHALILTKGFVFINNPDFEDFVVANAT